MLYSLFPENSVDGQKGEIWLLAVMQSFMGRRRNLKIPELAQVEVQLRKVLEDREQTERDSGIWLGAQGTMIGWDIS